MSSGPGSSSWARGCVRDLFEGRGGATSSVPSSSEMAECSWEVGVGASRRSDSDTCRGIG